MLLEGKMNFTPGHIFVNTRNLKLSKVLKVSETEVQFERILVPVRKRRGSRKYSLNYFRCSNLKPISFSFCSSDGNK